MPVTWNGPEFERLVRAQVAENLEAAAIHLKGRMKTSLRIGNKFGNRPSRPGEPPRRRTGRLSGSIAHEVNKGELVARVGTNVLYAKFLELGTRRMSARPFIRPALQRERFALGRILGRSR